MQPEGPNKTEELLQRYAKQRREQGGDFSLHPATRRLLQGEVARQRGARKTDELGGLTWFGLWRGRFAVGGALAAVLVTGAWIFWNGQNKTPMQVADAKMAAGKELLATRSAEDSLRPEPAKRIVTASPPVEKKLAENIVTLRSERDAAIDRFAKQERPVSAGEPMPRPVLTTENRSYFADFGLGVAGTNATAGYTTSLTPVPNTGGTVTGSSSSLAANQYGYSVATFDAQRNVAAPQLRESVAPASTLAFGSTFTNSVSLADNAAVSYNAPATLPTLAAKDASLQAGRVSQQSASRQTSPEQRVETRGGIDANRALLSRADAPVAAAPGAANKPVQPQSLATDKAKEQKSAIDGLDRSGGSEIAASGATGLAGNGTAMRFLRLRAPASPTEEVLAKAATDEVKKKSEQTQAPVLARFTIEQRGRTVRVVDADGSLYEGDVEVPVAAEFETTEPVAGNKTELLREKAPGLGEPDISRAQQSSFRASGSNVTLHQFVEVNGTFTQSPNPPNVPATNPARANKPAATAPAPAAGPATRRGFGALGGRVAGNAGGATNSPIAIEGTVRIGATNLQWFKAVRESR